MILDFTRYQTQAKYSIQVNEGYSACLNNISRHQCPYMPHDSDVAQAWFHGWDMAAKHLKGKR